MEIKFDRKSGEILDLLWSLYYSANFDYIMRELDKNNIEKDEEIEKLSQVLMNIKEIDRRSVSFFFNRETRIFDSMLQNSEVFGKTLDECLEKIEEMTEDEIILRLAKELLSDRVNSEEQLERESEKVLKENNLFTFISDLDISDGGKWNLLCFVKNIRGYKTEAAALIRKYAYCYYSELEKHKSKIDKFAEGVVNRLKEDGRGFISQLFKGDLRPEDYDEINITVTYLHYYSLYFYTIGATGNIVLGINYEDIIARLEGIGDIEKALSVLRNLSDKTRFQIMKLLLKKNFFGQELASEFNITTATVSYHMNQLFASNLVETERMEHKAFYKLNKETIRRVVDYLIREFEI